MNSHHSSQWCVSSLWRFAIHPVKGNQHLRNYWRWLALPNSDFCAKGATPAMQGWLQNRYSGATWYRQLISFLQRWPGLAWLVLDWCEGNSAGFCGAFCLHSATWGYLWTWGQHHSPSTFEVQSFCFTSKHCGSPEVLRNVLRNRLAGAAWVKSELVHSSLLLPTSHAGWWCWAPWESLPDQGSWLTGHCTAA